MRLRGIDRMDLQFGGGPEPRESCEGGRDSCAAGGDAAAYCICGRLNGSLRCTSTPTCWPVVGLTRQRLGFCENGFHLETMLRTYAVPQIKLVVGLLSSNPACLKPTVETKIESSP